MPPSRKTAAPQKPRKGQFWNTELRLAVLLLKDDFDYPWGKTARIFWSLFKDYLRSCGIAKPGEGALKSQYNEKDKAGKERWASAHHASSEEHDAMKARIQTIVHGSAVPRVARHHLASFLHHPNPIGITKVTKRKKSTPRSPPTKPARAIPPVRSETSMQDIALRTTLASPQTPRGRKPPNPNATIPLQLLNGGIAMITPEQDRESKKPLVPITDAVAHPQVDLLFRYTTEDSQSPLTESGYLAKRFSFTPYTLIEPEPAPVINSRRFPWGCMGSHLNRDQATSPFISTSFNFAWIIRQACKLAFGKERRYVNISVIDPSLLDRKAMFHAQPFQGPLAKKFSFNKGAWMYKGQYEMLVWAKIPKEAILFTFSFQDIIRLASSDPAIGQILRLDQLSAPFSFSPKILPVFKAQALPLSPPNVAGLATLCRTLRIPITRTHAISSLVSDIIQGFALKLEYRSKAEWAQLATVFANTLCKKTTSRSDYENTRWAFLDGCRWAAGEPNARQKPKEMKKMLSRSAKIGLESPGEILMHDIDLARRSVEMLERGQWELSRGVVERGLFVEDAARVEGEVGAMQIDEMELDDGDVGISREEGRIVYEQGAEEQDGDYDDDGSVFEL